MAEEVVPVIFGDKSDPKGSSPCGEHLAEWCCRVIESHGLRPLMTPDSIKTFGDIYQVFNAALRTLQVRSQDTERVNEDCRKVHIELQSELRQASLQIAQMKDIEAQLRRDVNHITKTKQHSDALANRVIERISSERDYWQGQCKNLEITNQEWANMSVKKRDDLSISDWIGNKVSVEYSDLELVITNLIGICPVTGFMIFDRGQGVVYTNPSQIYSLKLIQGEVSDAQDECSDNP